MIHYFTLPSAIATVLSTESTASTLPSGGASRRLGGESNGIVYFATNPAWVISDLLSASSSSRNCSMSLPVRKIGLSACFSM